MGEGGKAGIVPTVLTRIVPSYLPTQSLTHSLTRSLTTKGVTQKADTRKIVTHAFLKHKAGCQRQFLIEFFRSAVLNANIIFRLIISLNFLLETVYIWKSSSPSTVPQINFSN